MEIIILCVIIAILSLILFIALKKLIDSINKDSNNYYFQKIQDIDSKISEKQKQLDDMQDIVVKNNEERIKEKEINSVDYKLLKSLSSSDYENQNPLKIASKVDEIFQINEEEIIKRFINDNDDINDYKTLIKIKDRFSPNLIYKLKNLNGDNQISQIKKLLSDEEYEVFNSYVKSRKFRIEKFLLDLDLLIEKYNPNIEVIVGSKNKNYDYLSKYIETIYDENVYKGIIIKYKGNIYDYSINERDV